jgi:type II secretory pathway pseudopilin PulG
MSRRHRRERGFTMIELVIGLGMMLTISAAALLVVIATARSGRNQSELSGIQRAGRTALSLLSSEIENAGLGLPRRLAIRWGTASTLAVTSLDYRREWVVATIGGNVTGGTLTLQAPTTPYPSGTTNLDLDLAAGQWVFLYQNSRFDASTFASGFGLVQLGAARAKGTVGVSIGTTNYSNNGQVAFDLNQSLPSTPHAIVMLLAHTAEFGVDATTDPAHPFVYVAEDGGSQDPVARNIDYKSATDTGLQIGYYLDANCDGQPDDRNGDGVIDWSDTWSSPFALRVAGCDPAGTTEVQVTAVEVHLRLRSEDVDPSSKAYHYATFSQLIPTRNIVTSDGSYIFVDNTALCTRAGGC